MIGVGIALGFMFLVWGYVIYEFTGVFGILGFIISAGGTIILSLYMHHFHAPSVVEVRPELAEVDFWTALFSGRFLPWLWHHHPAWGFVLTAVLWSIAGLMFVFSMDG
jgi:hypothetical protein